METKIYGYSDDIIEIEGPISDEIGCFEHREPIKFEASDGTSGTIFYGGGGEWKIEIKAKGTKFIALFPSVGDDGEHISMAKGCTRYSDVLILEEGIEWVKVRGKKYKP